MTRHLLCCEPSEPAYASPKGSSLAHGGETSLVSEWDVKPWSVDGMQQDH